MLIVSLRGRTPGTEEVTIDVLVDSVHRFGWRGRLVEDRLDPRPTGPSLLWMTTDWVEFASMERELMPIHFDEFCDNTTEYCRVVLGCQGCRYCCPDHSGFCEDCSCEKEPLPGTEMTDCDCTCHRDGPSDESLRREERRQMGITSS